MSARLLSILLAACAALALWPAVVWLIVDSPADGTGFNTPLWLAFTIPTGFAAAAIVLIVHGLRSNADLQAEASAELEALSEQSAVAAVAPTDAAAPVSAGNGNVDAGNADATVAAAPRTARTARVERQPRSKADRTKRRALNMARRQIRRRARF